jgi:hypothetical protein
MALGKTPPTATKRLTDPTHLKERPLSGCPEAEPNDENGRRPVRLLADGGEPGQSDFRAFSKRERVLHIHTQVTHGILNLGVTEQDLHGAQVTCHLVDDRRFGAA